MSGCQCHQEYKITGGHISGPCSSRPSEGRKDVLISGFIPLLLPSQVLLNTCFNLNLPDATVIIKVGVLNITLSLAQEE